MTIDTKRLETDAAYWDEVCDNPKATHYCTRHHFFGSDRKPCAYCIPRPQSEWVDGLPGVGTRCLGRHKAFNSNFECEINGYRDGKVWFTDFSGSSEREFVYTVGQIEFSPIPTKAQRDRDELADLIANNIHIEMQDGNFNVEVGDAVDAAIDAGWKKP